MVIPSVVVLEALSAEEVGEVEELVAAAAASDGGHPVSEAALLALRDAASGARHLLLREGGAVAGYAQLPATGGAELLVAPGARRRGAGTALAEALEGAAAASGEPLRVWAHGHGAGAAALARERGYAVVRELQHRVRPLGRSAPLPPVDVPDDVQIRAFEVGRDERAWLDLNARAFADHPEQGRWTAADLAARQAEPWFDPAGLLLAVDAQEGRLLASHWTKHEGGDPAAGAGGGAGEVYVVAVDPGAQGRGLGRAVLLAGLHHLDTRGCRSAELYVEGDNAPALRLYEGLGFALDSSDALYERTAAPADRG
ncbi:mycothiol synthase [Quadrisphaera sp. INWT6]|uniref:mycothiol synthase n=1 Tax=Quadrisphaera sp. INWT6 TaxID=2596917 RepID=UPI0018920F6D|nr:mycothiol synthase [Quadrisphaera sp. INWT6]MBF5081931.1 mycothiol synthase [Quadrisphaera sp. INWT6]